MLEVCGSDHYPAALLRDYSAGCGAEVNDMLSSWAGFASGRSIEEGPAEAGQARMDAAVLLGRGHPNPLNI